jgi:hypothetical protein
MKEYMFQIASTNDGKIIEIPDVFVYSLALLFVITLFTLSNQKNAK